MDKPMTAKQFLLILWGTIALGLAAWGVVKLIEVRREQARQEQESLRQVDRANRDLQRQLEQERRLTAPR